MKREKQLGFGLMRLPKKDGSIDVEATARLADMFMDRGFTYFDTAYVYEGSEEAFRKAVAERHPRDSFTVADKLPAWALSAEKGPEDIFNESLSRCGVTYFDYYLMHNVNERSAPLFDEYNCWEFARRMKAEGKIRHLGFSFHGTPPLLEKTLSEHPEAEFVQLQINYVDWEDEKVRAAENYAIARRYGKSITVMEPIKGGALADPRPDALQKLRSFGLSDSPSSYALRWAASLEGVKTLLSGMNDPGQMEDNIRTFSDFRPLSEVEREAVAACRDALLAAPTVPCTACSYCAKGCPMQINIPEIIRFLNRVITFGDQPGPHSWYNNVVKGGSGRASDCIACGQCEGVCPQHLEVISVLQRASEVFDR